MQGKLKLIEEKKLFELYTLAELSYQKHFEKLNYKKEYLYPEDWYAKDNYKQKIEIIAEAIKKNILIENTTKYQNQIEGVKKVLIKEGK